MVKDIIRWARDVVTDQDGLAAPVTVQLADDGATFEVELREVRARIPIARRPNPAPHPILKEIHSCEVAGRMLEGESAEALQERVRAALEAIAPGGELPLLWFRAPATGYEVAAYRDGDDLVCPVLGAGRRLKAPTVAELREEVTRYLVSAGQLHADDDIEVRVLRARDVRRLAPAAVLRSDGAWLPCVAEEGGLRTLDPVGDRPVFAPDLVGLVRAARAALGDGALHAAEADPDEWRAAAATMARTGERIAATPESGGGERIEFDVLRTHDGDLAAAVDDGGVHVFIARDAVELAALIGDRLAGAGFTTSAVVRAG